MWQVYAIIFAKAMFGCFFNPARQAAVKTLVREDELMPANSLGALSEQLTKIIGPALSGIMVAALGINASFYLDGLTFLVSATFIAAVRFPSASEAKEAEVKAEEAKEAEVKAEEAKEEKTRSAFVAEFTEGLRFIRRTPVILFVMALLALTTFTMAPIDALISVYVREVLRQGSSFMGYMVSIVGIGTTVGAVLLGSLATRRDRVLLLLTAIGAMGVGVTFLSVTRSLPLLAAGGLIIGFASAGTILPGQTLIQELTPVGHWPRLQRFRFPGDHRPHPGHAPGGCYRQSHRGSQRLPGSRDCDDRPGHCGFCPGPPLQGGAGPGPRQSAADGTGPRGAGLKQEFSGGEEVRKEMLRITGIPSIAPLSAGLISF